MSVRVSSVFVLCDRPDHPSKKSTVYKIYSTVLILIGNRTEDLTRKMEAEELYVCKILVNL
jgi:hypothetical protein